MNPDPVNNEQETAMAKDSDNKTTEKKPAKGAGVDLIHVNGSRVPAKITDVNDDGTINLKTEGTAGIVITSSPFDPEAKKADAWAWPATEAKAAAKAD